MGLLWGLSPFIIYVAMARFFSVEAAMWSALGLAFVAIARGQSQGRSWKVLEIGSFILFALLAAWTLAFHPDWTIGGQRLVVDLGLFAIVAASLAISRPFTLQYARERVPAERWTQPRFIHGNRILSGCWAAVFAALSLLDLANERGWLTLTPFSVLTIIVIAAGFAFTFWYPRRLAGTNPP